MLVSQNTAMRVEGRRAVDFFKRRGLCRADLDIEHVADLIWAEAHPERYARLVGHAGWSREQFSAALTDRIVGLLEVSHADG